MRFWRALWIGTKWYFLSWLVVFLVLWPLATRSWPAAFLWWGVLAVILLLVLVGRSASKDKQREEARDKENQWRVIEFMVNERRERMDQEQEDWVQARLAEIRDIAERYDRGELARPHAPVWDTNPHTVPVAAAEEPAPLDPASAEAAAIRKAAPVWLPDIHEGAPK